MAVTDFKYLARLSGLIGALVVAPALSLALAYGQQARPGALHIGASASLATGTSRAQEEAAISTLRSFIKDETSFDNEITRQMKWPDLGKELSTGKLQIGVFEGYEFAWAQEKYPELKPLAIAINVYRNPVAYVVARKDQKATDFASLQGQTLAIPSNGMGCLRLFVERQSEANGKGLNDFFSKVTTPATIEDAVDDTVDGVVQATVIDRAGLEAYRKLKPGRFARLKEITHSEPFPPATVAYYNANLDEPTLKRFQSGLLGAKDKETGKMLLNLFRLTGFEVVPNDFTQVLEASRKAFPPPKDQNGAAAEKRNGKGTN